MTDADIRRTLDARLASGEISETEYDRILSRLSSDQATDHVTVDPVSKSPDSEVNSSKDFYLKRLWRGDISLAITYWVWGVLISLVVSLIMGVLVGAATNKAQASVPLLLLVAWLIFITVSVFRSGSAYQKKHPRKSWGRIAQVLVCLGFLSNIANIAKTFPGNWDESDLDDVVAAANKDGPRIVADKTRFEKSSRQGRTLVQSYTITGPTHALTPETTEEVRKSSINDSCKSNDVKRMLMIFDKIIYEFRGENKEMIATYSISSKDCP